MNLIPELSSLPDGQVQQCRALCFRQSLFTQDLMSATLYTLTASHEKLIYDRQGTQKFIRSAFLGICLPKSDINLFHSMTLNKRGETVLTAFKHTYNYARMVVASPLTFLKYYYDSDSVIPCFSEDEVEKSTLESMDPTTLEVLTTEANLMADALFDDNYGGILPADIDAFANAAQAEQHPVPVVQIPTYLKSYNRKQNSTARSVDFDNTSTHSDTESTLGDSRTRDIQSITAQVIAHLRNEGKAIPPVPTPAAISPSGQGR